MSSIGGSSQFSRGVRNENSFKAWFDNNVRDIAFGVLYAMAKENNFNRIFVIVSIVIEFFQMILFCFVTNFNWGGINIDLKINSMFGSFDNFKILYWIVVSFLFLVAVNVAYIGYTLFQGEIKSIILLRSLRWICSLIVTVLFIPVLYVLLNPLVCDYSTSPPMLSSYPRVQCWGAENMPISVIAIVLVVVFSVFGLLVGLTFYEYDPNMIKTYSRLQNRFEFGSLIIKIAIVLVSVFLHDHKLVYALFSFVTSLLLVLGYIIMVPAYDRRINLTRSGSYAGIFWVNVCMMIAIGIDDGNNLTSTIAAGVGCPLFIALGVFITDRRIKYLCNPQLVDVSLNSDDIVTKAPSKKPSKKGVKWDKPKSQELLKNALYARLKFPTDVEIAARFVLQERPNAALIEKAKTVYHTGMTKFPKSPTVLMAYTNFIFTTAGDWQLGYSTLEKLRKMHPFLDISFFIYRYDKDREQRIEGGNNNIGDYVDFMEYKKLMKAAKQYHHMALVCIRKFWRYLLDSKIDVLQLSNLSSKIAFAEKKATENYTKLLARYPKNIRVLRDYARFLDEVVSDEKLAQKFWQKADKYEEREMEKLTESHRSANNHPDPESHHEEEDNHSEDRSSHASDYSGDDKTISTTSSGVKSALEVAKLDKNSNLKKLGWIMFFTTLFAMVVMFTQLGVLHRQLGRFEAVVFSLDGAGGASHTGIRVVGQALDFFMYNTLVRQGVFDTSSEFAFMPKGWDYNQFRNTLVRNFNLMGNNLKSLYWGESKAMPFTTFRRYNLRTLDGVKMWIDPRDRSMSFDDFDHKAFNKGKVQAYFETPKWNQTMMIDTTGYDISRSSYTTDLWSFSFLAASCGDQLGTITPEGFRSGDMKLFEFTFAVENTEELANGIRGLMDLYSDMIISELNNLSIAIIAIFVAAVVLLLLASVVFFMPVVNSIFQYKFRTFYIFTLIPSSVVKHMIKKKISTLGNEASENEDDEDHYNNNVAKLGTHNKFGTWKAEGEQSGNESEEEPKVKARLATPRFGSEVEKDILLLPEVDETSSTAQPTQVAIEVSSNINKDEDTNEKEDEPGSQPSYIQQIKNKIWLKLPTNKFTKVPQNEKNEEEEQKQEKRHSRMNASSLKKVTRKLHFSYAVAIACIIIALMVAFITLISEFKTLNGISKDLKNSDIRTQYAHLVLYDIELLAIYGKSDPVAIRAASRLGEHIGLLWDIHKAINAPTFQMQILYGNGCYRINQTLCPQSIADYPYYDLINKGVEFTFMQYVTTAVSLQRQYSIDGYLNYTDPVYLKFRSIAENDIMDGLERLTYTFQLHATDQISSAKLRVGIITGVVCVAFVAIHIIIFKPFVRKLKEESEHTFSIIRMIPRKMLTDVAEIQEFIQESIDAADKD